VNSAITLINRGPKGEAGILLESYAAHVLWPQRPHSTVCRRNSVVVRLDHRQLDMLVPLRLGILLLRQWSPAVLAFGRE
jgi:hypothetical protein